MADKSPDRRVCSINGYVTNWFIGRTKFLKLAIEKEHCIDSFVLDANGEPIEGYGGNIKASLRVAEKTSWYLAEQEAQKKGITNEDKIEEMAKKILASVFGISESWLTTPSKLRIKMEQALKRNGYIGGEWRGFRNGNEFKIFVRYGDLVGSPYNTDILIVGNIFTAHKNEISLGNLKNPATNRWEPAVAIEDYEKFIGDAYFLEIIEEKGKTRKGESLDEILKIAMAKKGEYKARLFHEYAGDSAFDVNYTYATPVFVK